jgi:hypothetical protein
MPHSYLALSAASSREYGGLALTDRRDIVVRTNSKCNVLETRAIFPNGFVNRPNRLPLYFLCDYRRHGDLQCSGQIRLCLHGDAAAIWAALTADGAVAHRDAARAKKFASFRKSKN